MVLAASTINKCQDFRPPSGVQSLFDPDQQIYHKYFLSTTCCHSTTFCLWFSVIQTNRRGWWGWPRHRGLLQIKDCVCRYYTRTAPIFKKIGQFAEIFGQLQIHFIFVLVLNVALAGGRRKLHEVCENFSPSVIFTDITEALIYWQMGSTRLKISSHGNSLGDCMWPLVESGTTCTMREPMTHWKPMQEARYLPIFRNAT